MFDFTFVEWIVFAILAVGIHFLGFHLHRRLIIQRLMLIREELDHIKRHQITGRDAHAKSRELELMERAEQLLGSIGIDPYEHLREGHGADSKSTRS
jgi:hypothetical protein